MTDTNHQNPAQPYQGLRVDFEQLPESDRTEAIRAAFDYRGDVTIEIADGRTIAGYLFDHRGKDGDGEVRIWPSDRDDKLTIQCREIRSMTYTGRDTAEGKSWETWVKKYQEKKAKGEEASIYGEDDSVLDSA